MRDITKIAEDSLTPDEIRQLIDRADSAYYRPGGRTIISDERYDGLRRRLREIDPDDDRLSRVGPPHDIDQLRTKVSHRIPMGSLDNIEEGILGYTDWFDAVTQQPMERRPSVMGGRGRWTPPRKITQQFMERRPSVMASLKLDGASVVANYEEGVLQRVATRGNGEIGEDITANAILFSDLPTQLGRPVTVSVRGEAILYRQQFREICEREYGVAYEEIDPNEISNPRNVGNGILGRSDGRDSDKIHFVAFNLFGIPTENEQEKYDTLQDLGFSVVPHQLCCDSEQVNEFYELAVESRDHLDYEIDGVVVCLAESAYQRAFITEDRKTLLRPKYARAIKFPHKSNETTLLRVRHTVGHTGAIIPTAVLRKVRVGGVNVEHALLNNWDEIQRLQLRIGDRVEVILAGDIIPKIIRRIPRPNSNEVIKEPDKCPSCGEPTTRTFRGQGDAKVTCQFTGSRITTFRGKKSANTYCGNSKECSAVKFAKIKHFVGDRQKGIGLLGLGDTTLHALWNEALVEEPADLFRLTVDDIKNLVLPGGVRLGESRARSIVDEIQKHKTLPLPKLLGSLGIDLLGSRRVQLFQEHGLTKLEDWLDDEKLANIQIPGLGEVVRQSIREGIDRNRELLQRLIEVGVQVESAPAVEATHQPLAGKSFCLTGTREMSDEIQRLGGTIKNSVSRQLDYLVQKDAESISSKSKKARQYGIKIISIQQLRDAIQQGVQP